MVVTVDELRHLRLETTLSPPGRKVLPSFTESVGGTDLTFPEEDSLAV